MTWNLLSLQANFFWLNFYKRLRQSFDFKINNIQTQSQLHKFLIKLITHIPYIITHVRDTYCACGVYFGIIDEFLTLENLGELSYLLYNCLFYSYYHFMARCESLCNNITRHIK